MRSFHLAYIVCVLQVFNSYSAHANEERYKSRKKMKTYFYKLFKSIDHHEKKNNIHEKNMSDTNKDLRVGASQNSWDQTAFMLRVRPSVGFSLPGILSLKMMPETEFYWRKQM